MPRLGVTRRGFGEGSIYRRSDGRWVSYIRMPDGRKKFFTSASREVVKRRLDEAKRQADAGRLVVGRDQSLHEYLERWLADAVRHSVRPKTYLNYDLCVRRLHPFVGRVRLGSLTPEHIQHALGRLLESGLSARTVRQVHMVLRCALKQAVLWRLLATNPNKCDHFPMISSHARPYGRFRGPALTISARRPRGRHVRTLIRATWKSEV